MYRSGICLRPQSRITCRPQVSLALARKQHTVSTTTASTSPDLLPPISSATKQSKEGTIEEIFSSFHTSPPFPARFADLKKLIWTEGMVESWRQVLEELEQVTGRVISQGSQVSFLA